LLSILAFGCQDNPNPLQTVESDLAVGQAVGQLVLPYDATLLSAKFYVYVHEINNQTIDIHRVTAAWGETTVTWASFGGAFDAAVVGSFVADGLGWRSVDVTPLVQGWLDGDYPNYGLLMDQADMTFPRASYFARDFGARIPYLEICYSTAGGDVCEQVLSAGDTYIWQAQPTSNFGTRDLLYTGWLNESDLEKQSLVAFDVDIEVLGCTHTIGYWKNWSGFGPQPDMITQYLPIWLGNDGGDSSIAVQNADSAVQILSMTWDSSKNGIIKLYAQLLAAKLNFADGADDSAVADIVADADDFLAAHRWGSWYALSKTDQKMVLKWMETLDDYNNGLIGPGHCDDL